MSDLVILIKLLFGLSCYVTVGSSFSWALLWADALGVNEALSNSKDLVLLRVTIAVLVLTLTWSLASTKVGIVSWVKLLGWGWILTCGIGIVLGSVTSGITFTVIWIFVVGTAWVGVCSLLSAESQLLLSFSEFHTNLILAGTGIFGLIVGTLGRLVN